MILEIYDDLEIFTYDILELSGRYNTIRKEDPYNFEKIQDIRDEMSEALIICSKITAEVMNAATRTTYERKKCEAEAKIRIKKEAQEKGLKLTATDIKDQAFLDCGQAYEDELEADLLAKDVKTMLEGIHQTLNSISSRLSKIKGYYEQTTTTA